MCVCVHATISPCIPAPFSPAPTTNATNPHYLTRTSTRTRTRTDAQATLDAAASGGDAGAAPSKEDVFTAMGRFYSDMEYEQMVVASGLKG
jgi:hypothetical protein